MRLLSYLFQFHKVQLKALAIMGGMGVFRFQFHKVQLKATSVCAFQNILAKFQFHKVQLKVIDLSDAVLIR